jgi:hypothetical protein
MVLWAGGGARAAGIAVTGAGVAVPVTLDAARLASLPAVEITTATPWTGQARFAGPLLTEVLRTLDARASKVSLIALDDYKVDLSIADILKYQPIIAIRMNDKPIPPRERGPFWLMFPFDNHAELRNDAWYFRAIWQIDRIKVEP